MTGTSHARADAGTADAVADFLRTFPGTRRAGLDWTHWVTLTFARDVPEARALTALRWWLRAIAKQASEHIPFAFACGQQTNHRLHHHVLLAIPATATPVSVDWIDYLWRCADRAAHFSRVVRYDPDLGAVWYIAAHQGFWDVNVACPRPPRCRRRHCVEAPGPWR